MKGGWVYIISNMAVGPFYVGVTNDIARCAWEHRQGGGASSPSRYGLTRLVYIERHEEILTAIDREKPIKHWPRQWKLNLIATQNPLREDLFEQMNS